MSEQVANASHALSELSLWGNAIFLAAVAFAGIYLRYLGQRDKKSGVTGADVPTYLMLHDAAKDIAEIKRLLEDMRNAQQLRDTMAHPEGVRTKRGA
jgi:hypothetical protein